MTQPTSALGVDSTLPHPREVSVPVPGLLPENAGIAFRGETEWPPALLTGREARKLIPMPNACGRPNEDVLRRRLAVVDGTPAERWQVDFPAHFTIQEAALYEEPFALLQRRSPDAWRNPHASPDLRRALARVSRYLAMPADASIPDWRWIEEDLLPDSTLLTVARDDDFTHGVLSSQVFARWWHCYQNQPVSAIESFPFPWPPGTALSALTKAQEEQRHAVARAARSGNVEQLNAAISAAYGWPGDIDETRQFESLARLNHDRA
jgi:hypothetical protein